MKGIFKLLLVFVLMIFNHSNSIAQTIIEKYEPVKNDSLRIGIGEEDFLPFIAKGYTLMLPKDKEINGILVFLEDAGYDNKNDNSKQMYRYASEKNFAIISVSSELPFDFYFSPTSIVSTHAVLREVFTEHKLPNENVFLIGSGLVGHRALKYIEFIKNGNYDFQLDIKGIVICNLTMDWTRKWYQHQRDIRINRINLWEPKFINFMLESYLKGTPETSPENYHYYSSYSYFDKKNRNIKFYKDYAVRAYIEPAIKYRLKKYVRTLYENNSTDMVGFLAELQLAGNENTELIVLHPENDTFQNKNTQTTWGAIDKNELMNWIYSKSFK
ncbi:hypothetical protein [Maribacter aurantiacus]|uniref:Alpha/beta hydrolase n=1 Tax=Maribacter aurantiacus TaxID=1882343 RepID=A0A5R8M6T7_9FLAO|nr:hypothetical protein [Maribacter aurantiacus]TLF45298.1 hypothetical protein FEK29_07895 [Maribacter aurantiacus]